MTALIVFAAKYLFLVILLCAGGIILMLPKDRWAGYVVTACLAALLAIVLTQIAGAAHYDPRPFTRGVPALVPHTADNGFPSDHTVLSVTAALLALQASRRVGAGLLLLAAVVGIGRIVAGLHAPIDVLAGAAIGALAVVTASCVWRLLDRLIWGRRDQEETWT